MAYYWKRQPPTLDKSFRKVLVCEHCDQEFSFDSRIVVYDQPHKPLEWHGTSTLMFARHRAIAAYDELAKIDQDLVPCPSCLKYQSSMTPAFRGIYGLRFGWHGILVFFIGLTWLIVGGTLHTVAHRINWASGYLVPIICAAFLLALLINYRRVAKSGIDSIPVSHRAMTIAAKHAEPTAGPGQERRFLESEDPFLKSYRDRK